MDVWEPSNLTQLKSTKKWEGEDVDEVVADSWDQVLIDDDEEDEIIPVVTTLPINKSKTKLKKSKDIKKDAVNFKKIENKTLSADEIRKLQIEADLHLAKEVFGVQQQQQTILDTKDDFDKFKEQLIKVLSDANKNSNFSLFTEEIVQFLCTQLPTNDLRKIHNWIGNLQIQRTKQERGEKKKTNSKAKTRAKIRVEDDNSYDYASYDCDDFI